MTIKQQLHKSATHKVIRRPKIGTEDEMKLNWHEHQTECDTSNIVCVTDGQESYFAGLPAGMSLEAARRDFIAQCDREIDWSDVEVRQDLIRK